MENVNTKKPLKWYQYLFGFLFVIFIANLCSNPKKENSSKSNLNSNSLTEEKATDKEETPSNKWYYNEDVDKMTSKKNHFATLVSENSLNFDFPYNGGSYGKLLVRKKDGSTNIMLSISKGQFMTGIEGVRVRLRFDQEPAFSVTGSQSSDYSSDLLFLSSESKIINKLKKSKSLIVEAEFYNEGRRTLDFNIEGFEWKH